MASMSRIVLSCLSAISVTGLKIQELTPQFTNSSAGEPVSVLKLQLNRDRFLLVRNIQEFTMVLVVAEAVAM